MTLKPSLLVIVLALIACKAPVPVPMPKTTEDHEAADSYRNDFMFHLGQLVALQQDEARWVNKLELRSAGSEATKSETLDVLADYIAKSEDMVRYLEQIDPPEQFKEFHQKYVEMHQEALELVRRMTQALADEDPEAMLQILEEMASTEARFQQDIESICRKTGAKDLNDFLGIDDS